MLIFLGAAHIFLLFSERPNCGGNLTTTMDGNISSPNYPEPYDVGKHCVFTIAAESGLVFIIEFPHFDLEHSEDCIYDYLQVIRTSSVLWKKNQTLFFMFLLAFKK